MCASAPKMYSERAPRLPHAPNSSPRAHEPKSSAQRAPQPHCAPPRQASPYCHRRPRVSAHIASHMHFPLIPCALARGAVLRANAAPIMHPSLARTCSSMLTRTTECTALCHSTTPCLSCAHRRPSPVAAAALCGGAVRCVDAARRLAAAPPETYHLAPPCAISRHLRAFAPRTYSSSLAHMSIALSHARTATPMPHPHPSAWRAPRVLLRSAHRPPRTRRAAVLPHALTLSRSELVPRVDHPRARACLSQAGSLRERLQSTLPAERDH